MRQALYCTFSCLILMTFYWRSHITVGEKGSET